MHPYHPDCAPAHPFAPVHLAPRTLPRRTWQPISDAEYAELRRHLPGADAETPRRGRKPQDLRRTLDAIFWIAASTGPWRELPEHLGKPGTASRALRRWARAGVLEPLLIHATHPGSPARDTLKQLAWWIARAFRRMARIVSHAALHLAEKVLGLIDAAPAWPLILPSRNLSKTACATLKQLGIMMKAEVETFLEIARAVADCDDDWTERDLCRQERACRAANRWIRKGWRLLKLGEQGNRSQWKLR